MHFLFAQNMGIYKHLDIPGIKAK